jgi:hypothetical protein
MKITNKKILTEGWHVGSQSPIDDRLIFDDIADLIDLGVNDANAYRYYEGMMALVLSTKTVYIWAENSTDGQIPAGFTYPPGISVNGVDYSNRTFNFVIGNLTQIFSALGKVYFVSVDGNDADALAGSTELAYATLTAAKTAAIASGDPNTLIHVFPGSYQEVDLAYQNGSYYFSPGCTISNVEVTSASYQTSIIFDIGNNTSGITNFNVYGEGDFFINESTDGSPNIGGAVYWVEEPSFTGTFNFNTCIGERANLIYLTAGELNIKGYSLELQDAGTPLTIKTSGDYHISINQMSGSEIVTSVVDVRTFSGNLTLFADKVNKLGVSGNGVYLESIAPTANINFNINHFVAPFESTKCIANWTQAGGDITFNIVKMETPGCGAWVGFCSSGSFIINIDYIDHPNTGVHPDNSIITIANTLTPVYIPEANIKKGISSNPSQAILVSKASNSSGQNKLKLSGTIVSTDASAPSVRLDGDPVDISLSTEELTLICAGTFCIENNKTTPKNIKVNGRLSSNKPFRTGRIINIISGSNIIIDSNITE